jgi:Arsenite efflux pump ACR3 and related permeases
MTLESKLVKSRDHLDRFLGVYVAISIVIAFIIGLRYAQPVHQNINAIKSLEMVAIIIMIFPMMVMTNVSGLAKAVKNWKLLLIVLLMNFGWGPLMAIILGDLFVSNPLIRLGIFLAWIVPCSSMSIGYVGLMRGSIEAATHLLR